jgi:hypothetical protein
MDRDGDFLTPSQATRRLDVTPLRVRQLRGDGSHAYVATLLGRLVDAKDVDRLAAERERRRRSRAAL